MSSTAGSILFGGIDTDKYIGDLTTIDVQHREGSIWTVRPVESFLIAFPKVYVLCRVTELDI